MAADTLDVRMARLEGAYNQIAKHLDDLHGDIQQLRGEFQQFRGEIRTEIQGVRTELQSELHTGLRSQFWQFAGLVLPLWLAAAALLFRH